MAEYKQSAIQTIEAILKATSAENKELMALKDDGLALISFEDQLKVIYGELRGLHKPAYAHILARQIGQRNLLSIEKLKKEKELIDVIKDPTSFYKESLQKTQSDKGMAIKSSSDSTDRSTSFAQSKGRSGGSQSYEEHDLERAGDKSDESTLKSVLDQPSRHPESKDGNYENDDRGDWELVETKRTEPEKKDLILQNEREIEGLALDTVTLSINRTLSADVSTSQANSGKDMKSKKDVVQTTASFTKAEAIQQLQEVQLVNGREKILQSFACLFVKNYGNVCL